MVVCIALGVDDCLEGVPARPYISGGIGLHGSPSRVQLESYYNKTGSFLFTVANSTPIRVVYKGGKVHP